MLCTGLVTLRDPGHANVRRGAEQIHQIVRWFEEPELTGETQVIAPVLFRSKEDES